nr:ribonuclease H-like domain-containing protein [Tanacetum cinerariifolium]
MSFRSEKCMLIGYSSNKKAYKLLNLDFRNVFYSKDVKFYENVFPFKQKTYDLTDVENTSEVNYLQFFDNQLPYSPYDDGRDSSNMDGSLPHTNSHDSTQDKNQDDMHTATQIDDQNWSEGNAQNNNQSSLTQVNNDVQTHVLRRSDRVNMCFANSLNKSVEPTCLSEALSDPNCVEAMNNEIEALNRNNTWTICDLHIGRKPIGYVNNAFLYGDLLEDVYMTLLEGYNNDNNTKVCKLIKSLYGLKQALRQWNAKLTTALAEHGFEQFKLDYSLYTKHNGEKFIAFLVYVVDIVITGNNKVGINDFKVFLSTKFMIKDLGVLKYFFRIEVVENDLGLCMSQRKYCLELLHEYGLLATKPVDIPLPENYILGYEETSNDKYLADFTSYKKLVPLRVLRYFKGSPGCGVQFYKNYDLKHKAYADADWAKCPKTRREKVLAGIIKTVKISTNLQTADVFTKCLGVMQHILCCNNLGMLDVFTGVMVGKDSGRKGHAVKKKKKSFSSSA